MTSARPPGSARPGGTARLAGRDVSRIGYGAMQLGQLQADRAAAVALLRAAIEAGVDHIDTAHFYGDGFVNDVIGEAVTPDEALIVTKVGADPDPGGPIPLRLAQRPEQLRASIDQNLRQLGLDQLPLVNLRRADRTSGVAAPDDQIVDFDDQVDTMVALRSEGKIGAIGLSAIDNNQLQAALPAGIACVQNAYSLLDRQFETVLQTCVDTGIAWVPYFPLGGAFPDSGTVIDNDAVRTVADDAGATTSQVGLAWLLQHSPAILPIPGTSNLQHLADNLASGQVVLSPEHRAVLDALGAPPTP